ncbi:hypothetical protein QYE76_069293 [Lolium multiflorum]|uniref:FBD domain-containing protein n=1 Tax=Lolium multiflorum TaxID=4521 RepID=A0AAD8SH46_LOLMU|nr:hypothetical protein QYE76_069293 [Lolium multiflorum]
MTAALRVSSRVGDGGGSSTPEGGSSQIWKSLSLDLISRLSDEMPHIIISLLPMISTPPTGPDSPHHHLPPPTDPLSAQPWSPNGGATSGTPSLNLEIDDEPAKQNHKRIAAVSSILAAHPGPARSVSIDPFRTTCKVDTTLDSWFRSSTLSCVENPRFDAGTVMRSFPLRLYRTGNKVHVLHNEPAYPIECLDLHLKEISISDYRRRRNDVIVSRFFIQNTRMLKVMNFGVRYHHKEISWDTQFKQLDPKNTAYRDVDFQLDIYHP